MGKSRQHNQATFEKAIALVEEGFLPKEIAKKLDIPVIGIGAGGGVDGQVLVLHDMLGITQEFSPRFLRRYHNLHQEI